MGRRSYSQYCGLARALDLVGERWTLLIVRDLAVAPRRFTDLLGGLPGMGTSSLFLSSLGTARRRAAVYGCFGCENISLIVETSATLPA